MTTRTRRTVTAALAFAAAVALAFLTPAPDAGAAAPGACGTDPALPAPGLRLRLRDAGNGYAVYEWLDADGLVYDLGPECRLTPPARHLPGLAMPVVYTGGGVDVPSLITAAARRWGLPPDQMLRIAACESKYDPGAYNRSSGASGVFQFLSGTFASTPQGRGNVFDAATNIEAAMWLATRDGTRHWRACGG